MSRLSGCAPRGPRLAACALLALGAACRADAPDPPRAPDAGAVITDGELDEWGDVAPAIEDPAGDAADAPADLRAVRVLDEPGWLHLALDLGREINLQSNPGALRLLFDADGDEATGSALEGLAGVDVVVTFSRRDPPQPGGAGAGTALTPVTAAGTGHPTGPAAASLLAAPAHSARHFELRLRRGASLGDAPPLFAGSRARLKLVFESGAGARDETDAAELRFATPYEPAPAPQPAWEPPPAPAEGFRVAVWNVAGPAIRERPDAFLRVLAAIDPDVLLLDELPEDVTARELGSLLARGRFARPGPWGAVVGRSGGRQKGAVLSRQPLSPEPRLLRVDYPRGSLARLAPGGDETPELATLLAVEEERGLATAGARVEARGVPVLFVPIDLQSGGAEGDGRDGLRSLQARTLRDRIAGVAQPDQALVVGGDLNLVGSATPLRILLAADGDTGPELAAAAALRPGDRSTATWRSLDDGPWGPGRLDFLLYSPATLEVTRAFVFDSELVSEAARRRLGLQSDDSRTTSGHLPVVADLRPRDAEP